MGGGAAGGFRVEGYRIQGYGLGIWGLKVSELFWACQGLMVKAVGAHDYRFRRLDYVHEPAGARSEDSGVEGQDWGCGARGALLWVGGEGLGLRNPSSN